jgi:alpha-ketoglutarate-dependent 2,4-dichlorophenoxyacetate dioxygenase
VKPAITRLHPCFAAEVRGVDNRCVLHRGRPWDEARHRRVMNRTTVAGEGPTVS